MNSSNMSRFIVYCVNIDLIGTSNCPNFELFYIFFLLFMIYRSKSENVVVIVKNHFNFQLNSGTIHIVKMKVINYLKYSDLMFTLIMIIAIKIINLRNSKDSKSRGFITGTRNCSKLELFYIFVIMIHGTKSRNVIFSLNSFLNFRLNYWTIYLTRIEISNCLNSPI